jgi:hypothetical protein
VQRHSCERLHPDVVGRSLVLFPRRIGMNWIHVVPCLNECFSLQDCATICNGTHLNDSTPVELGGPLCCYEDETDCLNWCNGTHQNVSNKLCAYAPKFSTLSFVGFHSGVPWRSLLLLWEWNGLCWLVQWHSRAGQNPWALRSFVLFRRRHGNFR